MSKDTNTRVAYGVYIGIVILSVLWIPVWFGGFTAGKHVNLEVVSRVEKATGIPGVLDKNLCSLRESVYLDAYLKGRKAQRRIDVRAFEEECVKKIEKRKCAPLPKSKETKRMADEKKTKRRGRKKKKSTTASAETSKEELKAEPAAIDLPSEPPAEVVEATPEPVEHEAVEEVRLWSGGDEIGRAHV